MSGHSEKFVGEEDMAVFILEDALSDSASWRRGFVL